jgi:hypothetical protein
MQRAASPRRASQGYTRARPPTPLSPRASARPPSVTSATHNASRQKFSLSDSWVFGAWRVCLSAPRRATLFGALLLLGLIAVVTARTARSHIAPDAGRLVSCCPRHFAGCNLIAKFLTDCCPWCVWQSSVLSSASYVYKGQVVVDTSALLSALGVRGGRLARQDEKIAL